MANFWTYSAWYQRVYLYWGYELLLCKILYQYINKYGYYKYFPISLDFCTEFLLFPPPPKKKSNFGPIQLDIIVYIVSKVMNYNYAKFHAFIKKLTIDVIFRWL